MRGIRFQAPPLGRLLGFTALLAFIFFGVAAATFLSSGALFLATWVIFIIFASVGMLVLAVLPTPSLVLQRIAVPISALYLFLEVVWPRYATFRPPGMPAFSVSRLCLAILLLIGVFIFAKSSYFRVRLFERVAQYRLFFWSLAFLFLFKLVGIPFSDLPYASAKGVLNEFLSVYLPMIILLGAIESRGEIRILLYGMLGGMVVVLVLAVYEYIIGRNLFIGILQIDSDYMFQVLRDKMRAGTYRLQSTFAHPLTLSEFIVLALPMAIFLTFERGWRWWRFLVLVPCMALAVFVLAKSGSRSGFGGLALGISVCAVAGAGRLARLANRPAVAGLYILAAILFVTISALGIYFLIDIIIGRTSGEVGSGMVRLQMWQVGLGKALLSPVVGYGQDMAAIVLGWVGSYHTLTVDSYYLSILLDSGFIALGAYLVMMLSLLMVAFRAGLGIRTLDYLSICLAASILGFVMIKAVLSLHHNHVILMMLAAVLLANGSILRRGQANPVGFSQ
jgi:O-antigen ligase